MQFLKLRLKVVLYSGNGPLFEAGVGKLVAAIQLMYWLLGLLIQAGKGVIASALAPSATLPTMAGSVIIAFE